MPLKSARFLIGRLNQPNACGLDGRIGNAMHVELELLLVELPPQVEAAALVQPADEVDRGPCRTGRPAWRRTASRPCSCRPSSRTTPWPPSITFLCVASSISNAGTTWPGGHRLDLELAAGQLVDALGEEPEVVLQRQARGPGRLHLERARRPAPGRPPGRRGRPRAPRRQGSPRGVSERVGSSRFSPLNESQAVSGGTVIPW